MNKITQAYREGMKEFEKGVYFSNEKEHTATDWGNLDRFLKHFARKLIAAARESMPEEEKFYDLVDIYEPADTRKLGFNVARTAALAPLDEFLEATKS